MTNELSWLVLGLTSIKVTLRHLSDCVTCKTTRPLDIQPPGHVTRREMLSFWEMTEYHVLMTHGDTNMHRPPGSDSVSRRRVLPSSRNTDIFTLGRTKKVCTPALKQRLLKGFPLYMPVFPECRSRQFICNDILSCDVAENYRNKIQAQMPRWCVHEPTVLQCRFARVIGCSRAG